MIQTGQGKRETFMTEAEWLASTDLFAMLEYLKEKAFSVHHADTMSQYQASERKLRLFGCACCRKVWHLIPNWECRSAIEVVEKVLDGTLPIERLREVSWSVYKYRGRFCTGFFGSDYRSAEQRARDGDPTFAPERFAARIAALDERDLWVGIIAAVRERAWDEMKLFQIAVLRDVLGNPFRLVTVDSTWLTWNDGTVPKLAQAIYEERRFADLPILADALEEAGCTNDDILSHCRAQTEHVRGCWVVDALLGKE
jgi:hypothetical protein